MNATNASMPSATVIPVLVYEDVGQAVDWLCDVFGLILRLRIANHRAQLVIGNGAVVVAEQPDDLNDLHDFRSHSLLVRIEDIDQHYTRVVQKGVSVISKPTNYPYGERQYTVIDLGGHEWTFSQTIANVAPEEWGGQLVLE